MNPSPESNTEAFRPGDRVRVIGGTFVGSEGRVIDTAEARETWERDGGQQPGCRTPAHCVWAALVIFGRTVPVLLHDELIRRAGS